MIIVLIHWRIKPDKVHEFKSWWTSKDADIENRAGLAGEFLSAPVPLEELLKSTPADHKPFRVCDLAPGSCDEPYVAFVNVGLWQSWDEFYRQVGKNFNDESPKKDFEQYRRTRTILQPCNWRIGEWNLPTSDDLR
jgi:arylamine N-acetyltransferase